MATDTGKRQSSEVSISYDLDGSTRIANVATGEVTVIPFAVATATALADAMDDINISNKFAGKQVWDSTNDRPLWSTGVNTTDDWNDATGSGAITPS